MYYSIEWTNLWMGIKEIAFRTNAQGLNTTNAYNSNFRRFPIRWEGAVAPQPLRYTIKKTRSAGKGLDYAHAYRDGYEDCKFTITGEIIDFAFLYQLCGACTTAASYTHTYLTTTTPAQPTFQMLQRVKSIGTWVATKKGYTNEAIADGNGHITATMTTNSTIALNAFAGYHCTIDGVEYRIVSNTATAGATKVVFTVDHAITCTDASSILYMTESAYILYVGCKITEFNASYSEDSGRITGTLAIECCASIIGTPLTTDPTWLTDPPYYFNPLTGFSWTGNPGTAHTYVGYCAAWNFHYANGQSLRKANYLLTPDLILSTYRTIDFSWTWVSEELDDVNDATRDPITDLDQNIIVTLSGGDGNDSTIFAWVKAVVEDLGQAYDYKNFYLGRKYRASLNPALASIFGIVETNSADHTFYEG